MIYVTFTRKGDRSPKGKRKAVDYNSIDAAVCEYMGVPVDQTSWSFNWYNRIALSFAFGMTADEIKKVWELFPETVEIVDFLMEHFDVHVSSD
jgi:hypothetical protein